MLKGRAVHSAYSLFFLDSAMEREPVFWSELVKQARTYITSAATTDTYVDGEL
jgi:hypothetical protein